MPHDTRPIALLQQAVQARQQGQLDTALGLVQACLRQQPEHPDALHLMGDLALARGDPDAALAWLERSLAARPDQPMAWSRLGDVLDQLARPADALAAYRRAVALEPRLAAAHYNVARLLHGAGDAAAANAALQRALDAAPAGHPLRVLALQLRALLQQTAGELPAALATLDAALALAPQRVALLHNRGALLNQLARPAEALASFDHAAALGLDVADLHYNRANSLQSLGRADEAVAAYRAALAREPLHALALYDLARLRWRRGDADFDAELQQAAAAYPGSALAPGIVGRLMLQADRPADAQQAFATACAIDGSQAGYFDGLGQALGRLGRHAEAVAAHRRAVALSPALPASHVGLAAACLQAGELAAAQAAAEAAVALDGHDQQSWATLGLAWRASADPRDDWLNDYAQHVQVYDLPAPPGYADMAAFNHALAGVLAGLHRDARAPIDQTLRQGSQTVGNLFDQRIALVGLLEQRLAEAIDRYLAHLATLPHDARHPLLSRLTRAWRFSDSWSSRLNSGGFHTRHVHPHGWISSCYYVALPPVMTAPADAGSQAGWISFGEPELTVPGRSLGPRRTVRPAVGRLVLFPSCMWHGTVPFEDPEPRLTIAFDVLPRP
jgi:uncharacterized protein (TIGR02466 family)